MSSLENYFGLSALKTDVKTEVLAGLTSFLSMAYIALVNPSILEAAGMPKGAVITATCLSAAIACFVMGLYAKLPVGLAPGMGTNAYFAFYVCGKLGHSYETALGAVFLSGVVFLLLTVTGVRNRLMLTIPESIKHAVAAGIGLFIAFVGLKGAGIIAADPNTLVTLSDVGSKPALVTWAGLLLSGALLTRRIKGALLIGVLSATALAVVLGVSPAPDRMFSMPPAPLWGALDVRAALSLGLLHLLFAFVFVDLFDSVATLIAVAQAGGLTERGPDGQTTIKRAGPALTADAVGTVVGAVLGTSTVTSYVESISGVAEGGRSGLVACVIGFGFLSLLFISPLIAMVPPSATAPALILVAALMLKSLRNVPWDDPSEAIPAALITLGIPLSFSISEGLALGLIAYPALKLLAGRWRELSWGILVIASLFILKFLL